MTYLDHKGGTSWRPLRLQFAGALYHVTSRGNARGKVFFTDATVSCFCARCRASSAGRCAAGPPRGAFKGANVEKFNISRFRRLTAVPRSERPPGRSGFGVDVPSSVIHVKSHRSFSIPQFTLRYEGFGFLIREH